MAILTRGKAIFSQRIEYPLPSVPGVRDYVFHFVPAGDGYGDGARAFFGKFYPRHTSRAVSSLEALIDVLNSEVTTGGVSRIREVVIVSHGSTEGLLLRVLSNASDQTLPEYRFLTPFSLARLQQAFAAGTFATFRQRRQRVIQAMRDGSWVTVRACRFGSGADPMYALFSFFGGRANVYAPKNYQFFGTLPIMPGQRLETMLEAHDHLVRQRLVPHDVHTPERKDTVVQALIDPGRFSEPFELAGAPLDQPNSEESQRYQRFVDALNAHRVNELVRQGFAANGRELSPRARVRVTVRDVAWLLTDAVRHQGETFTVQYDVDEEIVDAEDGQRASLRVSAKIAGAISAHAMLPLQLFMYEEENNAFRGRLEILASYLDERGVPGAQQRFDALLAVLPQTNNSPIQVPGLLVTAFKDALGVDLPSSATVRLVEQKGEAPLQRLTWAVEHGELHQVKLEHHVSNQGVRGHSLSIFVDVTNPQRQRERIALTATNGLDLDTPGVELPAYLDGFGIDGLIELIDYLRSGYRAVHSYYLHHAQQAILRKKEYGPWTNTQHDANDPLGASLGRYEILSGGEGEDKGRLVYDFHFNDHWQEVLVSHPSIGPFQSDLFVEEDLREKLDLPADSEVTIEADSPSVDIVALRQLERQGREEFFLASKSPAFEAARDPGLSCAEFTAVLARWKQLQGQAPEEIRRLLGLQVASDGKTFLNHLEALWDAYQLIDLADDLIHIDTLGEGFVVKIVERIPRFAPSLIGTPTVLSGLTRLWPVFTIPLDLWMQSAESEAAADQVSENTGRLTAIRQWLRILIGRAGTENLPDDFEIDLSMSGEEHPFVARYILEQIQNFDLSILRFFYDPDRARDGFDEGVRLMRKANREILERADEAVAAIFRQPGMDACKIKALHDAGIIDLEALRGRVIMQIADGLLDLIPEV